MPCPYLVKKHKFCQNYNLLWAKKSIGCPFFRYLCLYLSINILSLKDTLHSCLYLVNTAPFLSKTDFSHVIFFEIFKENPLLSRPYLVKKRPVKTTLHYRPKKSACPFYFSFLTKKSLFSCPYFVKKTSFLQKTHYRHSHIL